MKSMILAVVTLVVPNVFASPETDLGIQGQFVLRGELGVLVYKVRCESEETGNWLVPRCEIAGTTYAVHGSECEITRCELKTTQGRLRTPNLYKVSVKNGRYYLHNKYTGSFFTIERDFLLVQVGNSPDGLTAVDRVGEGEKVMIPDQCKLGGM